MSRLSNIAATTALLLAVLVVGGVHSATAVAVAAFATVAVGAQFAFLRGRDGGHLNVSLFAVGFALLSVASLLQIVPVPDVVHGLLNPTGQAWTAAGLDAAGLSLDAMRPLSLDPAATADRAVRFYACAMMGIWAGNIRSRDVPWSAAKHVGVFGVIVLAVGFVLSAADVHSVFGLFHTDVGFRRPSPFISLNHGASFFGFLAIVACVAIARQRANGDQIVTPAIVGLAFLAAALIHDSDGVNLALLVCAAVGGALAWLRSGRPTPSRHVAIGLGLIAVMTFAAALWLDVFGLLFDVSLAAGEHGARFEVMRGSLSALADFWRFGAGGGGLETVISSYVDHGTVGAVSVPVVENETLELLAGYGVFAGGAAIACFVAQFVLLVPRALSTARSVRHVGALVVALFFALIAQLHFPLLPLGIVLPIVVWLELSWSRRMRDPRDLAVQRSGHLVIRPAVGLAICSVLFAGVVVSSWAQSAWRSTDLPTADADAAAYVWRRPADAKLYARLATNAARAGETDRAKALANWAVEREPSPRIRLFRARALAVHSPSESAAAYAGLLADPQATKRYVGPFLEDVRDVDDRVDALAAHPQLWAPVVAEVNRREGPDPASSLVIALTGEFPDRPEPYRIAAELYLQMNRPVLARLWAEQLAIREQQADSDVIESPLHLARALHASEKNAEARELLDRLLDQEPIPEAHRLALRIDSAATRFDDAQSTQRHHDALCVSPIPNRDRRICWETEARLAEQAGEFATARRVFQRVWKREGDPRPLARFLQRQGDCAAVRSVADELPEGRRQSQVEAIARRCLEP